MSQAIMNLQDAHSFQLLFRKAGYEPPRSDTINRIPIILKQAPLDPIDQSREVIVAHIKIEQDQGGFVSFLKFAAIPVNSVSVLSFFVRTKEGEHKWKIEEGELFITNQRLLIFYNSMDTDSKTVERVTQVQLGGAANVWYEENHLVIRSQSGNDICLEMKFPSASWAQEFGKIGGNTPEARYNSLRIKQDIAELKNKEMNAQSVLYEFFLAVIRNNQAGSATVSLSPELADLLAKLGELRNAGLITDDEFNNKKKELLSRM